MSQHRCTTSVVLLVNAIAIWSLGSRPAQGVFAPAAAQPTQTPAARVVRFVKPDDPAVASTRRTPHRLVLKLREPATTCLSCALARREALGELVPGSQLDALNRRFGVRAARPLLQAHADQLVPESHAAALARQQAMAARFAAREGRAPQGAAAPDLTRIYVLDVRARRDLDAVAHAYAADPAVEYCEPDILVQTAFTPNDPYFASSNSWGQGYDDLWGTKKIQAPAAWDTTHGAGVTVAVVDTGADYTHPDIAGNIWTNAGEIPNNGIDDDGNGYVDDVHGWNFVANDSDPMDDNLHGTHVSGTIAAVGNNGIGVVGVAFESRVMPVKALDAFGYGALSALAEAITYAVDNGADVINASWGGQGSSSVISDTIAYAHAHGVVFVAAAGNSAEDTVGFFPADDPNAVTVAATTHLDTLAPFSNFGWKLDVAAPGGGDGPPPLEKYTPEQSVLSLLSSHVNTSTFYSWVPSVTVGQRYLRLAGTSMAAPHVSATAALVLSLHPSFSVEQVRQVLRSTADDLGDPGPDSTFGYGRINAARAVAAAAPLEAHITAPAAGTLSGLTTVAITGSADGPGFASYTLEYAPASTPSVWTSIAGPVTTPVSDGLLANWDLSNVPDGSYILRLRAQRAGETFEDRVPLTFLNVVLDSPAPAAVLRPQGGVEIRGIAAGAGFQSYTVEYRRPAIDPNQWRSDGITLAVPAGTPVVNGVLATYDGSGLTAGDRFDFRLTVVNASGSTVATNEGIIIDPTLHPGWPQPVNYVGDFDYLTVADLDGNGTKQILVGSGDEVVVFNADGSIRPGWPQSVATAAHPLVDTPASPIVADVVGDSAPEVIATNRYELFVWSADGVLQSGFPQPVMAFDGVNTWLTAGDLNGDGKDEILCAGGFGYSEAFSGDGATVPSWDAFSRMSDMPFAVADVVGDGRVEVAMYNTIFASFFHGPVLPHRLMLRGPDRSTLSGWPRFAFGNPFTHPAMADLNGDGQLDLVVLNETGFGHTSATAFSANGKRIATTSYRAPVSVPRQFRNVYVTNGLFSFADLDGDGRAEAYLFALMPKDLFTGYDGFISFRQRGGAAQPLLPVYSHFQSWGRWLGGTAIGDIDGDGKQELVSGSMGYHNCQYCPDDDALRLAVVAAQADGTPVAGFPKPVPYPVAGLVIGLTDDGRYSTPAIADLDGSGLKQVIWFDFLTASIFVWDVPGTPGPELADWPMYHHDAKHTNVLPLHR